MISMAQDKPRKFRESPGLQNLHCCHWLPSIYIFAVESPPLLEVPHLALGIYIYIHSIYIYIHTFWALCFHMGLCSNGESAESIKLYIMGNPSIDGWIGATSILGIPICFFFRQIKCPAWIISSKTDQPNPQRGGEKHCSLSSEFVWTWGTRKCTGEWNSFPIFNGRIRRIFHF